MGKCSQSATLRRIRKWVRGLHGGKLSLIYGVSDFVPTRAAGLSRLEAFVARVPRYAEERNHDRPGRPTTARLSPWLQRRLITEEEVVGTVLAAHAWPKAEKFLQEVCWRTYWKGWLEHQPAVWTRYEEAVARLRSDPPAGYAEAIDGATGLPGFDDWARDLVASGWLHNHVRLWFASIWIFTLRLPWELGADFFLRYLLDGDAATNTLSWRWVAGLHTPGKLYLARADNIRFFSEGRHDLEGRLADHAFAVQEPPLPPAKPLWRPAPEVVPEGRVGWWLHPEDLCVEELDLGGLSPVSIFAAWPEGLAEAQGWSEAVTGFTQAALADGASRAAQTWGATVHAARSQRLAEEAVAWAREYALDTVVAMRPSVGPWRPVGEALAAALGEAGVRISWRQRGWDTTLYPLVEKGFFPFWTAASRKVFTSSGRLRASLEEQTIDPV